MPEISDADHELLKLFKKTLGSKSRMDALRIVKKENPDIPVPELEQEDRINAALAPIQAENQKLREERDRDSSLNSLREKRMSLKGKGYSDTDVTAIEKIMVEKGISSHETAAEFFKLNSQPAAPVSIPGGIKKLEVPMHEEISKQGASAWARNQVAAYFTEKQQK